MKRRPFAKSRIYIAINWEFKQKVHRDSASPQLECFKRYMLDWTWWLWSILLVSSFPADCRQRDYSKARHFNTSRPKQNGRHFADDIFKCIFLNENVWIAIKISLEFVPRGPTNNIPTLVQIMAWRRSGDKLLSEPMMVSLPTHICVIRPQWVNLTMHMKKLIFIAMHCTCVLTDNHFREIGISRRSQIRKLARVI